MRRKISNKTLALVFLTLILCVGVGTTLYTKNKMLVASVSQEYWNGNTLTEEELEKYNEDEKYRYDVIMSKRYYAFHEKDVATLQTINTMLEELATDVNYRKVSDKLDKVKLSQDADVAEKSEFNELKESIQEMILNKTPIKTINEEIEKLKAINTKVKDRVKKEKEEAEQHKHEQDAVNSNSEYNYYSEDDDYGYQDDGSGYQEPSSPDNDSGATVTGPNGETCSEIIWVTEDNYYCIQ